MVNNPQHNTDQFRDSYTNRQEVQTETKEEGQRKSDMSEME